MEDSQLELEFNRVQFSLEEKLEARQRVNLWVRLEKNVVWVFPFKF